MNTTSNNQLWLKLYNEALARLDSEDSHPLNETFAIRTANDIYSAMKLATKESTKKTKNAKS